MFLFGFALGFIFPVYAESHPAWWTYASPQATALVGIRWDNVQASPFAAVIGEELSSRGSLGFPDLECLKDASQILISSPDLLAIAAGAFPSAIVREQALSKGWKHSGYRGVELWITPGKETLSVAQISDQMLLLGHVKTLQETIDRSLEETTRTYSPLLAKAARYAQQDLWVVASHLPDPLANIFVPIDVEANAFAGSVSLRDGLHLEASITAESEQAAAKIAAALKQDVPQMPSMGGGFQIDAQVNSVRLAMEVTAVQLAAAMRKSEPVPVLVAADVRPPAASAAMPVSPKPPKVVPPQIVRIWGLDEGPREIILSRP